MPGKILVRPVNGGPHAFLTAAITARYNKRSRRTRCGPVAQLGARLNGIQEVTGSIPVRSTTLRSPAFMSELRVASHPSRSIAGEGHPHLSELVQQNTRRVSTVAAKAAEVDCPVLGVAGSQNLRSCGGHRQAHSAYSSGSRRETLKQSVRNQTCSRAAYVDGEELRLRAPQLR